MKRTVPSERVVLRKTEERDLDAGGWKRMPADG